MQCISRSCERAISAEAQEADTTPAAAAAATTTHAVDIQTALAHHPTTQCMHWLCSVLFLIHMTQTGASGLLRDPSALQQRRAPTLHPMRLVCPSDAGSPRHLRGNHGQSWRFYYPAGRGPLRGRVHLTSNLLCSASHWCTTRVVLSTPAGVISVRHFYGHFVHKS